jgi:hypothetical protein
MVNRTKDNRPTSKNSKPRVNNARQHQKSESPSRLELRTSKRRLEAFAWTPTPGAQKIIDACQDVFDNTPGASGDCNKFVKSVCDKFNINPFSDADDADAITNDIRDANWCAANGWAQLDADPQKAKDSADQGELVIAGATGSDLSQNHGHVVVVVSSELLWKGYPYASWGVLGGVGKTNEKMTLAYKLADLPKVSYMTKKI